MLYVEEQCPLIQANIMSWKHYSSPRSLSLTISTVKIGSDSTVVITISCDCGMDNNKIFTISFSDNALPASLSYPKIFDRVTKSSAMEVRSRNFILFSSRLRNSLILVLFFVNCCSDGLWNPPDECYRWIIVWKDWWASILETSTRTNSFRRPFFNIAEIHVWFKEEPRKQDQNHWYDVFT